MIDEPGRLGRSAAFPPTLRDSGVGFMACGVPEANDSTAGIMAFVAQQERDAISRQTNEALAVVAAQKVMPGATARPLAPGPAPPLGWEFQPDG